MLPAWRWITRLTVVSPMPVPGNSLSACRRWKGLNSRSAYLGSNPAPLSHTSTARFSPSRVPLICDARVRGLAGELEGVVEQVGERDPQQLLVAGDPQARLD